MTTDHKLIDQLLDVVPTEATPGARLLRLDKKYRAPQKLAKLQPRHLAVISYMIHGVESKTRCRQLRISEGVPLSLIDAADAARVRRREARRISLDPLFRSELRRQLNAWREQLAPEATQIIAAIARDPGAGLAADRTTQLKAASILSGDSGNSGGGGSNNVQINIDGGGQRLVAGIVIKMPATAKTTPTEQAQMIELSAVAEPPTIFERGPDGTPRPARRVTE